MSRINLIRSNEFPYHVTGRANNQEVFPCPLSVVWSVFSVQFVKLSEQFQVKIHAFVLMPNHFHLLISTPEEDLGVVMRELMRTVTKIINSKTGRSGRIFGAKYHWSLIDNSLYYDCALKYVYRNPVKANLSLRAEDYPFTSLKFKITNDSPLFPISPALGYQDLVPYGAIDPFLLWLERPFQNEQYEEIRRGLRKTRFVTSKTGPMKRRVQLYGYDAAGTEK